MNLISDWRKISLGVELAKQRRLEGRYRWAYRLSLRLAAGARQKGFADLEFGALAEVIDSGKVIGLAKSRLRELAGRLTRLADGSADDAVMAEARVRRGALLRALDEPGGAVKALRALLSALPLRRDPQLHAYALWNLGFAYRSLTRIKDALGYFHQALGMFAKLSDRSGVAFSLCGLAGATRLGGNSEKSLALYRRARTLFNKERDPYGIAYASCGVANALRKMNRFEEAVPLYRKAGELYRGMGDQVNETYVLWGKFVCLRALGRFQEAGGGETPPPPK